MVLFCRRFQLNGFAKVKRTNGEYFKIDKQGKIVVVSE